MDYEQKPVAAEMGGDSFRVLTDAEVFFGCIALAVLAYLFT